MSPLVVVALLCTFFAVGSIVGTLISVGFKEPKVALTVEFQEPANQALKLYEDGTWRIAPINAPTYFPGPKC